MDNKMLFILEKSFIFKELQETAYKKKTPASFLMPESVKIYATSNSNPSYPGSMPSGNFRRNVS